DISFDGTCSFTATNNVFRAETGADGDDCFLISLDGTDNVTMVINDNSFFGNNGGLSLERGISLEMTDSSQATLTASGNECSLMDEPMVTLDLRSGANLTLASFSGNSFDQNVDGGQPEVDIDLQDATDATVVFDNNNITNSDERGIQVFTNSSGLLSLALRNNTITGTTGDAVEIQASPGGNICAEISNNVFGANLNFNDQTAGQFDVEQFGNAMGDILATLNTFNAGGITVSNGAPNSVADGACTIP
ncbi:MAG: hypothetical protein KC800_31255, partial [Candidatus Eremiobacteraeota bacterium]|nr:hypothetical protein [Candidatus Eremiobacteraeota bacterium]